MRTLSILFAIVALVVTSLATTQVQAWWAQGHMLVAMIAQINMDQKTIDIVNAQFRYLSAIGPFPEVTDMVTGASWADDVKGFGLEAMSPWHFTNNRLYEHGYVYPEANCPIAQDSYENLLDGFIYAVTGYHWPHKPVTNGYTNAFATAYVVHLSGDASQPLHGSDGYSTKFPEGDRGGNKVSIFFPSSPKEIRNLHSVWDSVCGEFASGFPRPLSPADRANLTATALHLNSTYPLTEEEANMLSPKDMSQEAFNLAKTVAYPGVYAWPDNVTINASYIAKCTPVAHRQLVRAGVRLARNLQRMFKNFDTVPDYIPDLVTRANAAAGDSNTQKPAEWNSKATGGFIGGIILGVGLCVVGALIHRHRAGTNQKEGGYSNINDNSKPEHYGSDSQASMRTASAV